MNRFDAIANVLANGGTIPSQAMSMHFVLAKVLSRAYAGGQIAYLVGVTATLWQEMTAQVRVHDAFAADQMAQMPMSGRLAMQINTIGVGTLN